MDEGRYSFENPSQGSYSKRSTPGDDRHIPRRHRIIFFGDTLINQSAKYKTKHANKTEQNKKHVQQTCKLHH